MLDKPNEHAGTIVFDKTGTLTVGKPVVSQIISFERNIEPKYVLECAAIAEKNINHPIAKAIEQKAIEEKIKLQIGMGSSTRHSKPGIDGDYHYDNDNNFVKVGRGVTKMHNGKRISVGNLKFMEEEISSATKHGEQYYQEVEDKKNNHPITSNLGFLLFADNNKDNYRYLVNDHNQITGCRTALQIAKSHTNNNDDTLPFSSTASFVSVDKKIIGAVLFEDKLREGTREAISKIKTMGIHIIMLTGDNDRIAKRIADEAGIKEYHANLLPHDKVSKINEIVQKQNKQRKTVIMVDDGINDAPALAKADVGLAMGKTGTDIAIETADVVLMKEDLAKIPYLLRTSRQALLAVQQNFFGTLFIDGLGFILAFFGFINPLLAAIIRVSSELVFMINSARLLIDGKNG